jgi:aldehyde dehydrogenase (NAD+)
MVQVNVPQEVTDYQMVIDGERVASRSGDVLDVEFPFTRESWATVPEANAADVDAAVKSAQECYESDAWQSLSATERGELLFELADCIEDDLDELVRMGVLGNGKLVKEMVGRIGTVADFYRYFGGLADKTCGDTIPTDLEGTFAFTRREPYGVVAGITPWNSPLSIGTYKVAPAIAAGNTVVLKPSEVNPVTTIRLAELALDAGFPPGALNVVTGYGDAGAALTGHEGVSKVAFTGGLEAGSAVGKAAGENVVPVTLELGGKSPNIVFPDADLDAALNGTVRSIFSSSGQSCNAGSRLFLHEDIHDDFVSRLVDRAEDITVGSPLDPETDMGPIAEPGQFEKINELVATAEAEGASLETGGEALTDHEGELLFPPTIFTDVRNDMTIASEELFGPVLSVFRFSEEDEVVDLANDTEYGLAAGVWTTDLQRGLRMTDRIDAGIVWVNTYRQLSMTIPFGGMKKSGIGRENGRQAIEEYLQTKSAVVNTSGVVPDPFTPYEE